MNNVGKAAISGRYETPVPPVDAYESVLSNREVEKENLEPYVREEIDERMFLYAN